MFSTYFLDWLNDFLIKQILNHLKVFETTRKGQLHINRPIAMRLKN